MQTLKKDLVFNMKLDEYINKIDSLKDDEKEKLARYQAPIYFKFCLDYAGNIEGAKTLFFGSIATIIGIDLKADEQEFMFFKKTLGDNDLTIEMFEQYVKAWTNVKTIEDTDYLIDNEAPKSAKDAFVVLCILFALANNELKKAEVGLIAKYVQ